MGPLIPLVWTSVDVLKSKWAALFTIGRGIHVKYSETHPWCNTCQPLGSQYGSQANYCHIPVNRPGGARNRDLLCHHCEADMLCQLNYAGSVRVRTYLRQITDSGWNSSNGHLLFLENKSS